MVEDAPDSLGPEAFGGGGRVHSIDAVALGDHDATDVPSYAWGIKRYTERLHGTRSNTAVFELLLEALEGR
jgi:hypothetical protein